MELRLTGQVSCLKQLIYVLHSVSFLLPLPKWAWKASPFHCLCEEPGGGTQESLSLGRLLLSQCKGRKSVTCLGILSTATKLWGMEMLLLTSTCVQMKLNRAQLNPFIIKWTRNKTNGAMAFGHCLRPHSFWLFKWTMALFCDTVAHRLPPVSPACLLNHQDGPQSHSTLLRGIAIKVCGGHSDPWLLRG